jgi:phosphoglycerate dehydrogenase-like enzyme
LCRSDYVSISCPLTKESRGMIGARQYAMIQPHAYFITTARGFIHDAVALEEGLREKRIAGAGLDVWAKEPPPPDHRLLQFDNVLASPHTAGVTREARENCENRGRADARYAGRQAAAAPCQSASVARLRQAFRAHLWICAGIAAPSLPGCRAGRPRRKDAGSAEEEDLPTAP